jgi:hypothetical protein
MTKKKANSKATAKSTAKRATKKKSSAKGKTELNPAEVRKDISKMVQSEAATMAQAVIDEGKKGQLAPVRYLLELAKIFPEATDGSQATEDEDCLARTLLRRLDLPEEPIARDDEDEPKAASASGEKPVVVTANVHEANDSGSEPKSREQKKEAAVS